ncbi:hypothetical protein WDU94_003447, partial [Cyamophila willieti]
MDNVTATARNLLRQRQQQPYQIQSTSPLLRRFQLVHDNIPDELEQFLQLSEEFIHMGSSMLASAYASKCLQYMNQGRAALIQNMSVAGSMIGSDLDSRSNAVGPWINQNQMFMNRTGSMSSQMSYIGPSNTSTFKRPLPCRPPLTNRKKLNPIHESHVGSSNASTVRGLSLPPPPPDHRLGNQSSMFRQPGNMPGSFARPAAPTMSGGDSRNLYATSSDSDVPVKPSRGRSKVVRSTPIRPDLPTRARGQPRDTEHYLENDENLFAAISPLSVPRATSHHNGVEAEDDLLTKNSPSTRSNTKRRVVKVVRRKKPLATQNPSCSTSREDMNSTITRLGRISKPPKKFSFMEDNSILQTVSAPPPPKASTSTAEPAVNTNSTVKKSAVNTNSTVPKPAVNTNSTVTKSAVNTNSTVTKPEKKRKLLPTVEDEAEVSVRQRKKRVPALEDNMDASVRSRK